MSRNEPIAIVGSACRFAGKVNSPSKLWELLKTPRDVRKEIPESRFSCNGFYHSNHAHHGHMNVKHSYLLEEDPSAFDAEFFGINPMEAKAMDPQHRQLLETVYESVEAAGMTIEGLRGSDTAVYAGLMCGDYEAMLLRDMDCAPTYLAVGTSRAVLSNRISYFFDWHGASMTIDTACSSSMVAVHNAVQALRAGDAHMAVACGSNVILGPEMYIIESKVKMLSPDGLGRMWDKDANGYARGDGVAAIVLKTLSSAIAHGDHIECVIRETALNQDGATAGLTVPSASAQRALIRSTYAKAGLDLSSPADRPQYFEAHGTGTPAGDPIEAEAISSAFFGEHESAAARQPLYVGSIKTVLGHTEGTAGIAAILKASLAIQHSTIPPNLLFNELSPAVAPFYNHLEILQHAAPWQSPLKRASVNSFGFGGTNAHAILESYEQPALSSANVGDAVVFAPFVFSAASEEALRSNLAAHAQYLNDHPTTNLGDLAYTLRERRSVFQHRIAFDANSVGDLTSKIVGKLDDKDSPLGTRTTGKSGVPSKILGVFTGQGAQYASMGASLIRESPFARDIIQKLESHLASLPAEDRPTWSLEAELLADDATSRVQEAVISQPLCTAVQILLVDILATAEVRFDAVVGHSSGEIGAAYAAGYLSAHDAICVAYYRGLHCRHAKSPNGDIKGAMLAVGTSLEDAEELVGEEDFAGRVGIAASNSSSSVTISGDEDAIKELQLVLEDEKKFNRRLRVDQAYHSRHMIPCSQPYIESLRRIGVEAQTPQASAPIWYSSVREGRVVESTDGLSDVYWTENMTSPVLFSQAVTAALRAGISFDAVLEVGPHPALKGPASQTVQEVLSKSLPYSGTLLRNENAIGAFSRSLGYLWSHLERKSLSLGQYEAALCGGKQLYSVLKGVPTYQWNHETRYWSESRRSRKLRLRQAPFHPLLGDVSPDSAPHVLRWKNFLKPGELPWLEGHQVQNQVVFPAAGYVATAIEAAQTLGAGNEIRLIELSEFCIHQAVMFDGNTDTGVEVQIELSEVSRSPQGTVRARFVYSVALGGPTGDLTLAADGELKVTLGEASPDTLPKRQAQPPHMIEVNSDRLYSFMESLEYNFSGVFRSLKTLSRKLGRGSCIASKADTEDADQMLVHPVDLDAAFQSVMLAYSYPGDGQLRTLHLPTSIAKVRVNPAVFAANKASTEINVDSVCSREDRATPGSGFSGSVSMFTNNCSSAAIQVDQVKFKPVGQAASDDRNVFYKMEWVASKPDGHLAAEGIPVAQYEIELQQVLSRIATFYLRKFDEEVPEDSPARSESPLCHYLHYARHMNGLLKSGEHKYAKKEWLNDTLADVQTEIDEKGVVNNSDVRIMLLVGETMPKVFRGETTMLEHFRTSGLLDEYYQHGFGTKQSSLWLGNVVKQITDRHPHLNLLEIGAGTGGATKSILRAVGDDFDSYTFTDISSSFFENAAETFAAQGDKMVVKTCNAEQDPREQGFEEGAYDVVIAYMVIHATAELEAAMKNLRRLLKPGGFVIIGEGSSDGPLQSGAGFIFGPLSGWWRGVDEGRTLSPLVNVLEWDHILRRTGFSGIDTMSPPKLLDTFGITLFVSQAVDSRIELIRQPLAVAAPAAIEKLVVIGGEKPEAARLSADIQLQLKKHCIGVFVFKRLEEVDANLIDANTIILSLTELDQPVFKDITTQRWDAFRKVFEIGKNILWITSGRLGDDPWSNMTIGFGRSAVHEEEDLKLQFLDVPDSKNVDSAQLAGMLLLLASNELDAQNILHTFEPELVADAAGRQLVPRLKGIASANNRYNSIGRTISHEVDPRHAVVELKQISEDVFARELSRYEATESVPGGQIIELNTTQAVLSAIKTPAGHLFVAIGSDSNGGRHLALVSTLTTVLKVSKDSAVPIGKDEQESLLLARVAAALVSMAVLDPLYPGQRLVVHEASQIVAQAIASQAWAKGVEVSFTTNAVGESKPRSWIQLPPYMGRSELSQVVSSDVASFVGFANTEDENQQTLLACVSPHCRTETTASLFAQNGVALSGAFAATLKSHLERATSNILKTENQQDNHVPEMISLQDLANGRRSADPLTLVEFTASSAVLARVGRLDNKPLFKGDKTYWLVGLSGALGISLCDWMIDRGVKNLVLTSRNPKIDQRWIDDHARNGVLVQIIRCDVTDESAIRAVYQRIADNLPPIVGVPNGAMVLRDVSIRNMDYEHIVDVTRPKVLGSLHLDRIFHDVDLDFFVLLSSINCVIGNVGQANYAAANMGMCGVAMNRRKRGLRSSVVNVGAVIGIGYITDSARQLDVTVAKAHMMHLSEEDFHQIFLEAIEAGHQDCSAGPEISTGLLDITPDSDVPKWFSDPKFARFIVNKSSDGDDKKGQGGGASVQERLQACYSEHDVLLVIREAFATQLRKMLQNTTADEDLLAMDGSDLGLDSLISVDIRSWFLKNFQVSIPVLKIMANDVQMSSLVEMAVEMIPAALIPGVEGDSSSSDSSGNSTPNPSTAAKAVGIQEAQTPASTPPSTPERATTPEGIDWDSEAQPPRSIAKTANAQPAKKRPEVVLLTGSSGLLGHHLLNTLVAQSAIKKVICIAVRRLDERIASKQLPPPSDRIEYHEGDLRLENFGLSDEQAAIVFGEVDAVVHNGSDTSHLKYYSALKQANVESTKQLVKLCLPRMIPIHYISSAGVALFSGKGRFPEISCTLTGSKPPVDGAHGYMCGKWVCELMLERLHAETGLKVVIQRPSTIIRAGDDALAARAEFDWVNALFHYSHKIETVPKVEYNRGAFDLVSIETCCEDVARELLTPTQDNDVTYVNNVGDVVVEMGQMAEMGQRFEGREHLYKAVPMREWSEKAVAAGLHPAVAALIETFDEPGLGYPQLVKGKA